MIDRHKIKSESIAQLQAELNKHFDDAQQSWDDAVQGKPGQVPGLDQSACDLWDGMPTIDSKAVARAADIFEKILKIPFSAKA